MLEDSTGVGFRTVFYIVTNYNLYNLYVYIYICHFPLRPQLQSQEALFLEWGKSTSDHDGRVRPFALTPRTQKLTLYWKSMGSSKGVRSSYAILSRTHAMFDEASQAVLAVGRKFAENGWFEGGLFQQTN